jgi:hypothetical protein
VCQRPEPKVTDRSLYRPMNSKHPCWRGRVALIGLDGATVRVLDPLFRQGVLPALTRLSARGTRAVLTAAEAAAAVPSLTPVLLGVSASHHLVAQELTLEGEAHAGWSRSLR